MADKGEKSFSLFTFSSFFKGVHKKPSVFVVTSARKDVVGKGKTQVIGSKGLRVVRTRSFFPPSHKKRLKKLTDSNVIPCLRA